MQRRFAKKETAKGICCDEFEYFAKTLREGKKQNEDIVSDLAVHFIFANV